MDISYLRVSTSGQKVDSQRTAIEGALGRRPDKEFADEGISGRTMRREGLDRCLDALRPDDTLWIYSLSRLGRSSIAIMRLVAELTTPVEQGGRGVTLRSVTEAIDTSTPSGRAFVGILSVLHALEAETLSERTRDGLEAARRQGRVGGRRPSLTPRQKKQALALYETGERPIDVGETMGVSERTVWRAIRDARATREKVHGTMEAMPV